MQPYVQKFLEKQWKVLREVHIDCDKIKELNRAKIILDFVSLSDDGHATVWEVKYKYTAVQVGHAVGQLYAYRILLADEKIFEEFKSVIKRRAGVDVKDISYSVFIVETDKYLQTGIDGKFLGFGIDTWVFRHERELKAI